MASRTFVALLAARASSFVAPSQRRNVARVVATHASAADYDALSARLGDKSVVENMFIGPDGEPRQFLRREQFTTKLVQAAGPALSEDAAYRAETEDGSRRRPSTRRGVVAASSTRRGVVAASSNRRGDAVDSALRRGWLAGQGGVVSPPRGPESRPRRRRDPTRPRADRGRPAD